MAQKPDLSDSRILVLGGARGIGKALCDRLRAAGADLEVLDREAGPGEAEAVRILDMTDRAAVRAFCDEAAAAGRRFDAVVITAAIHGGCPAAAMSDAFIARLLHVNLGAHMGFVRDVLPLVTDGGRIVGISSNCAEIGIPMESAYAATKAGLERFYEALALETADRRLRPLVVQVGNVNTGFNETGNDYQPSGEDFTDTAYRQVIARIDSRHGLPPDRVAAALVDLLARRNPPFRTLVGMNARKTFWARRLAGTGIALKLLARTFGLQAPAAARRE
ncbi:MAG: SDR family NAD(P)-dependent oxidoreductase [Alphaproteobacteria bacterium]|jgi:NAD(P)-dependent dehydrogenase (short-subunit alcohol dehydrogenase family)|nr:SDR family NAD(P)-dependent oxidoreductase [Alphaproteobacteria bacterium]